MPLLRKCEICGTEFKTKPFFVKRGQGRFCSAVCQYKSYRTGRIISCFVCREEAYRGRKKLENSKSGKYFCSKSCQTKWRNSEFVGPKHANWLHGRASYKSVLVRNKVPKLCALCGGKDERVLATHHIDQNRLNNMLENLAWLCHNCHFLVHHYDEGREKGLLVSR